MKIASINTPVSFNDFYNAIWNKIPEVWRTHDSDNGNPLQLITLTISQQLYYHFYLKIVYMEELFDIDKCPEKYLPFLSSVVGWSLIGTDVFSWRQQLRSAPLLYKIRGTTKSITIAEKLIGYSVFMTELYRDYLGEIVPKEKIFNNIPDHVKTKPWFRAHADESIENKGYVLNSFSDMFQSFIEGQSTMNERGAIVYQRHFKKIGSGKLRTTLPSYNYRTGTNSLVRFSKLPRINVLLKKDKELDASQNVLAEAIDLLLSFKPFHVLIGSLEIRYDLSDFALGYAGNKDPGTGKNATDTVLQRESIDLSVVMPEEAEIIEYIARDVREIKNENLDILSNSKIKGALQFVCKKIPLENLSTVTDVAVLEKAGFSLTGYSKNTHTSNGEVLWTNPEFEEIRTLKMNISKNDFYAACLDSPITASSRWSTLLDTTHVITKAKISGTYLTQDGAVFNRISSAPDYSFLEARIPEYRATDLRELLNLSNSVISNAVLLNTGYFNDAITVTRKTAVETYSKNAAGSVDPISLTGLTNFPFSTLSEQRSTLSEYGTIINTNLSPVVDSINNTLDFTSLVSDIANNTVTAIVSDGTISKLLYPTDFKIDANTGYVIFNTYSICQKMYESDPDTWQSIGVDISTLSVYLFYAERVNNEETFASGNQRGTSVSQVRKHAKFNRLKFRDSSNMTSYIESSVHETKRIFNTETGILENDAIRTRSFKEQLPRMFTRGSLQQEGVGATGITQIVSRNPRNCRNIPEWEVYAEPAYSLYMGSNPLDRGWWATYFNVLPQASGEVQIPYTSVATDGDSQINNRKMIHWKTAQSRINPKDPAHFLATRQGSEDRNAIWNRGSASSMPKPYIGSGRKTVQGFRSKNSVLFDRVSNIHSRNAIVTEISDISRYDYSAKHNSNLEYECSVTDRDYSVAGVDYTNEYLSPSVHIDPSNITPQTERHIAVVAKTTVRNPSDIIDSGIVYPTSKYLGISSEYEYPMDFTDGSLLDASNLSVKTAFYANNININDIRSSYLTDTADDLELNISGLVDFYQLHIPMSPTDNIVMLSNTSIYIIWREVTTGKFMGSGYSCNARPDADLRPSLRVHVNGIEYSYGNNWEMASNPPRIFLRMPLTTTDRIEIRALSLDSDNDLVNIPRDLETGHVLDSSNTMYMADTLYITDKKIQKNTNYILSFSVNPVISWYRKDTGAFCSVSMSRRPKPVNLTPKPLIHPNLADPDVIVSRNGVLLVYMKDWVFIPGEEEGKPSSYRIMLLSHCTHLLQFNDSLTVQYLGLK